VTVSQRFVRESSLRCAAETASTMVSDDISSTKLLTDVKGMSKIWLGPGPSVTRPR
jgi:hypothetical protein